MPTDYLLIDYENVQPMRLPALHAQAFQVIVFVGANQARITTDLAIAMQRLGDAGQYVRISGNGRNALDFHIAFMLGQISAADPESCFHVISRDAGFDPLLVYLRDQGFSAQRYGDIEEIPALRASQPCGAPERLEFIVRNLRSRGNAKPRKRAALMSTINALFQKSLGADELDELIEALQREGYVSLDADAVTYDLARRSCR